MTARFRCRSLLFGLVVLISTTALSQTVPAGIHYQAVARDNMGKELTEKEIDVRFSVISGNTLGPVVYQEVHSKVRTSKYGVFSLIIGKGEVTGGTVTSMSQVSWGNANYFVKVEVKFNNDFVDMGTMQFLAVPYALYALKSLEPGPTGPQGLPGIQGPQGPQGLKGDQGDPASNNQKLSFDGTNLTIGPNGNTVNLSILNVPHQLSIVGDTISILGGNKQTLPNQIQDLTLDVNNKLKITKNASASEIDLTRFLDNTNQTLSYNSGNNNLSISGANSVDLTPMKQDLSLSGNILSITNKLSPVAIDLSKFIQSLTFNPTNNTISISDGNTVDLSALKNDADADPTNELQTLTYDKYSGNLTISSKNTVNLFYSIGFKAKKSVSQMGLSIGATYPFVNSEEEFDEGPCYDTSNGSLSAPTGGIYTFYVYYKADGTGSSRVLSFLRNGSVYEILGPDISAGSELTRWVTIKLNQGDIVSLTINTGMSTISGTGSFSGYRVN